MSSTVFLRYENTQSCTCGGARAISRLSSLLTPPPPTFLCEYLLYTARKNYARMLASTREMDMELQIIITIFVTAAVGFCGGVIFSCLFELPAERQDRLRRKARSARREKNRKNVNFTIDKF